MWRIISIILSIAGLFVGMKASDEERNKLKEDIKQELKEEESSES